MKKKLILLITALLLFTSLIIPVSAMEPIKEVESIANVTFRVDNDVNVSDGKHLIQNNIITDELLPYQYKVVNQEVKSENLPSAFELGIEKPGYTFTKWKIIVDAKKPINESNQPSAVSIITPVTREVNVIAEAQWKKNTLNVYYNINYGTFTEDSKYDVNQYGTIIKKSTNSPFKQTFTYKVVKENGLVNASTFGLKRDGYVFVGWSPYKNGKTLLNENTAFSAENITTKVVKEKTKITLYAQWMPKTVNIIYALNNSTESLTNSKYNTEKGVIRLKDSEKIYSQKYSVKNSSSVVLNKNIFGITKPFSEFIGWTTEQGSDKVMFKPGEKISFKKILPLLTKDGKVIRLYPVWKNYAFPLDRSGEIFISSLQGSRLHPVYNEVRYHAGLDIAAGYGTEIYAVEDGIVKTVGVDRGTGYGNYVEIDHGNGVTTLYAHASSVLVKRGQKVSKGDVIAKVGSTGTSTGNHLHLELKINGELKDPMDYINFKGVPVRV